MDTTISLYLGFHFTHSQSLHLSLIFWVLLFRLKDLQRRLLVRFCICSTFQQKPQRARRTVAMAYAAVITLNHILKKISTRLIDADELEYLKGILERLDETKNRRVDMSAINALDAEIREAVYKLEDVVESYLLLHQSGEGLRPPQIPPVDGGWHVKLEFDSFLKTVKKLGEEYIGEMNKPMLPEDDECALIDEGLIGNNSSITVGLSGQVHEITKKLLDFPSGPKSVALVGMAGIGKTHLAREIYQHPLIAQHFDFIAWVSVGQKHRMKKIFVDILVQAECKPRDVYLEQDIYALVLLLQMRLHGLRYLIFLDDVWSLGVQFDLIRWLPYNRGGRRFFLTTRLEEVALNNGRRYFRDQTLDEGTYSPSVHDVCFLSNEDSWKLLRQNVFADEYCSPQLEIAGRKIAENCEGLPLVILTVADILRGFDRTEEYWNKVADNKTTTFPDAYDRIWDVLFSSYEFLPQHLKPCFLYMGVFPQRFEILRSKLINLWPVEDFLHKRDDQTFEDLVSYCVQGIFSNSLVIRCKQRSMGGIKSFKIHSAYWHLCVKEAKNIKFFHVLKILTDTYAENIRSQRRLSVQNNTLLGINEVYNSMAAIPKTRSLLFTGKYHQYPVSVCFDLVFLKVLEALAIRFYEFPTEVVKLSKLKYLALTHNGVLPSSISNLQQLQSLILCQHHNIRFVRGLTYLPKEIWDMQELRHLRVMGSNLPDPTSAVKLSNISTLYVNAHSCTEGVFRSLFNLKKLGIHMELRPDVVVILTFFEHINLLDKLESFTCAVVNPRAVAVRNHLSSLPNGLKKLSLKGLGYPWDYITTIGSLPSLEVLKLRCYAFQGPKWKTNARQFKKLKFLLLEDINLVKWTVENNYKKNSKKKKWYTANNEDKLLPKFQRLVIQNCYKLKAIPSQIGGLSSLETIEVVDCSPSVVASAQKIQQMSNSSLQVVITSSWNC